MPLLAKRLREMRGRPRTELTGLLAGFDNGTVMDEAMGLMKERLGRGVGEMK